ncbi:MAG: hypothetical protein WCJ30_16145, partial [Deltaproteobacteria bacterium]
SWHLQCRADGFFPSRTYVPLPDARARWSAAGAALARAATREAGVAELRVAFVGHADRESLDPATPFVPCSGAAPRPRDRAACALGLGESCAWPTLSLHEEPERARGNEQLAFCRGASAAHLVAQGFVDARGGSHDDLPAGISTGVPMRLVVAGAGPAWQARHGEDCGADPRGSLRCDSARRVDLFIQFVVDRPDDSRRCPLPATTSADVDALACVQDCYETLDPRAPLRAGASGQSLFAPGGELAAQGWIISGVAAPGQAPGSLAQWVREIATDDVHAPASETEGGSE